MSFVSKTSQNNQKIPCAVIYLVKTRGGQGKSSGALDRSWSVVMSFNISHSISCGLQTLIANINIAQILQTTRKIGGKICIFSSVHEHTPFPGRFYVIFGLALRRLLTSRVAAHSS